MISAIEARKLSDYANDTKWIRELTEVEEKIRNASLDGQYYTFIHKKLENKTITKLKENGYSVEYIEQELLSCFSKYTEISWK